MQIIMISGPRWAGVQRVVLGLEEAFWGNLPRVVYHTSRKPINGEVDGKDFHFVSRKAFALMAKGGEFVWVDGRIGISRREILKNSRIVVGVVPEEDVKQLCRQLAQMLAKDVVSLEIYRILVVSPGALNGARFSFDRVVLNRRGLEHASQRAVLAAERFLKFEATTFFQE